MSDSVIMISQDGSKYEVPSSGVEDAANHGWKTEEQVAKESSFQKAVDAKNAPGFQEGDKLDTLAGNFLDTATLGTAPIVEKWLRGHTPEEQKIVDARKEQSEAENPIANKAASAAGFAGSMLIPGLGEVGKAAEHAILPTISEIASKAAGEAVAKQATVSAGRQLAGKVAKNMAMAEAYNAPAQIANLAIGDPNQAAESLGLTLGLGGLLGAGEFGLGKYIIPSLKSAATKIPDFLDQSSIAQHGIDASKLTDNQSPEILNLIKKEGGKVNPQSVIDDRTSKIQGFRDLLDNSDMDTKTPILSDTQQNVADKLKEANQGASPISNHIGVNPDTVKQQFMTDVMDSNPSLFSSDIYAQQTQDYSNIKKVFDKYGAAPTSFDNVDILKKELDGLPDGQTIRVNGKDMNMKDIAKQYLQHHDDAQMAAGLSSLDGDKLSEYLSHQKDLKTAQMMQDPKLQLPKQDLQLGSAVGGLIGGTVGGLVGHPVVGAFIGSGGNPSAAKGILSSIAKKAVLPFATKTLSKLVETSPEMFGNATARAANDAVDSHLSGIKDILFSGGKNLPVRSVDALGSFLGDEKQGLSKDQQYQRVVNNITNGASNPASIVDNVGALTSVFGDNPHLQNLIAQHNLNAIQYLNSIVPKNPNPPQGFSKNDWQPSAKEKNDFINQLAIVDNPMIAVHKAAAGTLTSKEVNTLQTVYPTLYQKIVGEVTKTSYEPDAHKIPNHTKVATSILTKQPMVPSMQQKNMTAIQAIYTPAQPQQNSKPKGSSKDRDAQGEKLLTSTQKQANK